MKRRWMYVILAMFFAVFFLYSCVSPTTTNSKEVTIVIDRSGANRNATLVLAQDGLEGTWKELTGTNGTYKFTVNDSDGVYSIVAVDEDTGSDRFYTSLFHGTLAEAKTVNIPFFPDSDTDFATLTVNVPSNYATARISVFFLGHHEPNSFLEDSSTTVNIPKGKGTLAAIIIDPDTWSPLKVYVNRNFDFPGDKVLTIKSSELKDPGQIITGGDNEILYSWVLGNTIVPGHLNFNTVIPQTLMNSTTDKYMAEYLNWQDDIFISWGAVSNNVPLTIREGIKELTPATTTISATAVENNLPKITFSPYTSNISGYNTRYYEFDISKKVILGENTYGSETHSIIVTPGYLNQSGNVYKFPNIDLPAWKDEYKPVSDYVVQSVGICLSPNTIDEINSLKIESEWTIFYSYLK
ncbi:MAG TPA: hypothetical protein PKI14_04760 [Fervidobacterium sp.]|nr:hypothetical protein [Fervidobacterium sp.]HQE48446.1 hypothetical protein [Fervidobacterium sp.]HUM42240.1 hypothetical protein [Fervidobacterium sp.]